MLSSRLSGYNRVWSCPACRVSIITEAPDTEAGGERERRREGKAKLGRTELKEGLKR